MTNKQVKSIERLSKYANSKLFNATYILEQANEDIKEVLSILKEKDENIQRMQELLDLSDVRNVKKDKIIDDRF